MITTLSELAFGVMRRDHVASRVANVNQRLMCFGQIRRLRHVSVRAFAQARFAFWIVTAIRIVKRYLTFLVD